MSSKRKFYERAILKNKKYDNPFTTYSNDYPEDSFILTRQQPGVRFILKPNLKSHPYLYRGQKNISPKYNLDFSDVKMILNYHLNNSSGLYYVKNLLDI